jgi:hypothetical protein
MRSFLRVVGIATALLAGACSQLVSDSASCREPNRCDGADVLACTVSQNKVARMARYECLDGKTCVETSPGNPECVEPGSVPAPPAP